MRSKVLANSAQARKRARQNDIRRERNAGMRSKMRTFVKRVRAAIEAGDKAKATEEFKLAQPVMDSMVNKGIVNKNAVARYKSRLNSAIKAL